MQTPFVLRQSITDRPARPGKGPESHGENALQIMSESLWQQRILQGVLGFNIPSQIL